MSHKLLKFTVKNTSVGFHGLLQGITNRLPDEFHGKWIRRGSTNSYGWRFDEHQHPAMAFNLFQENDPLEYITFDSMPAGTVASVTVLSDGAEAALLLSYLLAEILKAHPEIRKQVGSSLGATDNVRPPAMVSKIVQQRATKFKKIKDANPDWSQYRVALQVTTDEEKAGRKFVYSSDHVRNAYRSMGWKWEKATRIR